MGLNTALGVFVERQRCRQAGVWRQRTELAGAAGAGAAGAGASVGLSPQVQPRGNAKASVSLQGEQSCLVAVTTVLKAGQANRDYHTK